MNIVTFDNENQVTNYSALDGICAAYESTINEVSKAVEHLLKASEILNNVGFDYSTYTLLNGVSNHLTYIAHDKDHAVARMTDDIRKSVWDALYKKLPVNKFMTQSVKSELDKYFNELSAKDFTKENITSLIDMVYLNGQTIITEGMKEVFKTLTRYHSYKTNDKYGINKKVILDHYVSFYFGRYRVSYYYTDTLNDIDRIMCYLDGANFNSCQTINKAITAIPEDANVCESTYFKIKCYKKGTIHLEFKDDRLRKELCKMANDETHLPDRA